MQTLLEMVYIEYFGWIVSAHMFGGSRVQVPKGWCEN
jgi:hypothetical protein